MITQKKCKDLKIGDIVKFFLIIDAVYLVLKISENTGSYKTQILYFTFDTHDLKKIFFPYSSDEAFVYCVSEQ